MRYYGLHATCKAKKVKMMLTALMVALGRLITGTYRIVAQKTYRERVMASTGRDPLRCTRCGGVEQILGGGVSLENLADVVEERVKKSRLGVVGRRLRQTRAAAAQGTRNALPTHPQ